MSGRINTGIIDRRALIKQGRYLDTSPLGTTALKV